MLSKAKMQTESSDAQAVAKSLEVDNIDEEDISIETYAQGKKVITEASSTDLKQLMNTLDDLITHQKISENMIKE